MRMSIQMHTARMLVVIGCFLCYVHVQLLLCSHGCADFSVQSLLQLPRKPRLGSREPRDCPSEFYAVGAVCVNFIYGPKIPKKTPKDPRGTPEGAQRRPDATPKTVPRRVKIASRWSAGILRGGRRARKKRSSNAPIVDKLGCNNAILGALG